MNPTNPCAADAGDAAGPGLAPQPISLEVLREKYLKDGERGVEDLFDRVARVLASVEGPERRAEFEVRFRRNLEAGAIGAGRIMSAAGTGLRATLINCFVQPVGDCIQGRDDEGQPGIYEALREAAETMRRGGGVGYDFSRIRPRGAIVRSTGSLASGPCSYINVFDQSCATVESAGARRGAQMGVLRIDHPDVAEFIGAKRTPGRWNNFNVSVGVPDAFVEAVLADRPWELVHRAEPGPDLQREGARRRADGLWVYRVLPARALWDLVMHSAYDYAEPGILFLDRIREDNNLRAIETISATNPCGEQPLPAYGCCDLGPVILPRFVRRSFGHGGAPAFDFDAFGAAVALQVRALDNVLELTHWPLPQQQAEAQAKRRVGVGFTGLGDALIMLGLRYDAPEGREMARRIAERLRDAAYAASVELACEKGAFPLFDAKSYLAEGTFASRLPPALQEAIRRHGIRNSHLLSVAPTGTVSLAFADNASNGIEPAFAWTYVRRKREADGSRTEHEVQDHAWRLYRALGGDTRHLPPAFVGALEMSAHDHVAMMEAVQPFIDTAISKTVNVPADCPYEDFKDLYLQAWRARLKGLATYRPNTILGAVLEAVPQAGDGPPADAAPPVGGATAAAPPGAPPAAPRAVSPGPAAPDPMRAVIERRPNGALDAVVEKIEYWTHEGHKTLYLVVSFLPVARADGAGTQERAIEFFMPVGQSGESQQWITASMRLLSLAARGGFLDRALADLRKVAWDRGPVRHGHRVRDDGTQVPLWHESEVSAIAYALQAILARRAGRQPPDAAEHVDAAAGAVAGSTGAATSPPPALPSDAAVDATGAAPIPAPMPGRKCPDCGAHAMIRRDGCDHCTACGFVGACG